MRYNIHAATSDWTLLEVVKNDRRPCSDAYADATSDEELGHIFHELRLLISAGCPPDRTLGNPEIEMIGKHKPGGRGKPVSIFDLKCKPSGWRLYFYIRDRDRREIEFLYSVHKKRNARDKRDFGHCASLLDDIFAGHTSCEPLWIPPR